MGKSEGRFGVWMVGHRDYVGGLWDEIGLLQFEFLKSRGLKPHHVLVDIACGSLRAGVHFIPCLDRGNYLGLDREGWLVRRGIKRELSSGIDFEALQKRPDFALVQSLFTHLNSEDIRRCLTRLRQVVDPRPASKELPSQAHRVFRYTRQGVEEDGADCGWATNYIGDWSHPRKLMMVEYVAA